MNPAHPIKVGLISLGCAKNLVDSEVMLGALLGEGFQLTGDAGEADVLIVNTCGFIEASKQESIHAILQANRLRESGHCKALIMTGCLTQRYPNELRAELPEVDAIVGLNEVPQIGRIARQLIERNGGRAARPQLHWSGPAKFVPDFATPRYRLTPRHFAYVKIAEGCNHPCTFCSIPRIRGRHRSRQSADVLAEIRALVAGGAREINLISQDTTFYGRDLEARQDATAPGWQAGGSRASALASSHPCDRPVSLGSLLRAAQEIPGQFWVRLLYTHPAHWTDELIETIAGCDKVCRYVDVPLQHINDEVLAAMRRETDGAHIRNLIARLRAGIPGIALRTTFIVGFPGETDAQFEELLEFVGSARFERVGVFAYSQEDHTAAGNLPGQTPARVKQRRYRRLMQRQQQVARDIHRQLIGRAVRVLVEKRADNPPPFVARDARGPWWIARSEADAPEIDGTVHVRGAARAGEFARVRIEAAAEYDLAGRVQ
jgi:ribosomal protein S12 methylthiotransferase